MSMKESGGELAEIGKLSKTMMLCLTSGGEREGKKEVT